MPGLLGDMSKSTSWPLGLFLVLKDIIKAADVGQDFDDELVALVEVLGGTSLGADARRGTGEGEGSRQQGSALGQEAYELRNGEDEVACRWKVGKVGS